MTFVFALALMVGAYILTALLTPKPSVTPPALLSDFNVPTTDEGTPQAVIFGDCWSKDWTVLWYGDLQVQSVSVGGKKAK